MFLSFIYHLYRGALWTCRAGQRCLLGSMRALIHLYRLGISPWLPVQCRFRPTCSDYALEALQRHGLWHGGWLSLRRIGRCHPLTPAAFDPVPPVHSAHSAPHTAAREHLDSAGDAGKREIEIDNAENANPTDAAGNPLPQQTQELCTGVQHKSGNGAPDDADAHADENGHTVFIQ